MKIFFFFLSLVPMKGIGVKGASQLLAQYETLDECISHKGELKGKRLIGAFENYVEDLYEKACPRNKL